MQHYEGNNIGGILSIEYCPHYGFSSFNPAVLNSGYTWKEIPIKPESGMLFHKSQDTRNGAVNTYSGSFFIHNLRAEVEKELYPFVGQYLVFRITDMNGKVWIIGAPGSPVSLAFSGTTGQKFVDENGAGFTFEVEQTSLALTV